MPTQFLNVDLDLESKQDLGPLLAALAKKVVVISERKERGVHHLSLELYEFSKYRTPDACIARFVQLVRRLPRTARRAFDGALKRRFDIGIEAASGGATFTASLTSSTLKDVGALGGEIIVTVYAPKRIARGRSKT